MRASLFIASILLLIANGVLAQTVPFAPRELILRQHDHTAPALLDVRTPAEYRAGHIAGALNLPVGQLAARYGVLGFTPDQPIVVYCKSGRRAARAQGILRSLGYRHVQVLDGSMNAWQAAGRPVVREGAPRS